MRRLFAFVLACVFAVAGCGGDDGDDDTAQIEDVVTATLVKNEPKVDCTERLSDGFIAKTYETRAQCVQKQAASNDDLPDSVAVTNIKIDGDNASAEIAVTGGDSDGAKGSLTLVNEDGDWRIDDFSAGFLRALVANLTTSGTDLPGAEECLSGALTKLPDDELKPTAYALIGETAEGRKRTYEILAGCPGEEGASLLHDAFAQGLQESFKKNGVAQDKIDCVIARLRADVTNAELVETLIATGDSQAAATARLLDPALNSCDAG